MTPDELTQIRKGRKNFIAMAGTYTLGIFNDNFFKQAVLLLALSLTLNDFQGWATIIFTGSYVLVASIAGWLADKYSKRNIIIASKLLEVIAMICGAVGFYIFEPSGSMFVVSWILILIMLGIMGAQSSIFSPALNGSLPELYPASYVVKANGIIKMSTTLAILLGIFLAGVLLDRGEIQEITPYTKSELFPIAIYVVIIALLGFLFSFGVPKRPAAGTKEPFPKLGPLGSFVDLWKIRKDYLLFSIIWTCGYFWFIGALILLVVNEMGVQQFGWGEKHTSYLLLTEMLGIAIGAILVSIFAKGKRWYRVLIPSLSIFTVALFALGFLPYIPESVQYIYTLIFLGIAGIGGGLYLIPQEAFIQVRPEADQKGRVIAVGNFIAMGGSALAGLVYNIFYWLGLDPTEDYFVMVLMTIGILIYLYVRLKTSESIEDESPQRGGL